MTTRTDCLDSPSAPSARTSAPTRSIGGFLAGLLYRLAEWQERAEQRTHLAGMDDRMLKDIGINSVDAVRESSKPFWKS